MASLSDMAASACSRALATLGQIGRRILVHLVAMTAGGLVGSAATSILPDSVVTTFAAYIGLICLFPRGNPREPAWYIPTLLGTAQAALLIVLGMPWPLVFLWGGLQTWVQRLLASRNGFGWEWAVAPMLVMSICLALQDLMLWKISLWPLFSLPVVTAAGLTGLGIYRRTRAESIHARMLDEALQVLHRAVSWRALPDEAQQQAELLLAQATAYKGVHTADAAGYALVERVDTVSRKLESIVDEVRVLSGDAGKTLARNVLRSSRWKDLATRIPKLDELVKALRECNTALLKALNSRAAARAASGRADNDDAGRMAGYEDAARQLLLKKESLPARLQRHVEDIAAAALGIVECMRGDPADVPAGHKFLGRYLSAVHRVVDEYVRLAAENAGQEDVKAALARSGEILERMATAFADERKSMLQNDAINYTAELNALDAMLKMRGK